MAWRSRFGRNATSRPFRTAWRLTNQAVHKFSSVRDTWLWETLAIVASVMSMIVVACLLAFFNNQLVFDWHGVTLNALVSVFSTISKTTLAFAVSECLGQAKWIWLYWDKRPIEDLELIDSASRGPLGAANILRHSAARSFISLGAVIVLLSIAIDPFVQLLVGNQDQQTWSHSDSVTAAYATRYSKGALTTTGGVSSPLLYANRYFKMVASADFGMQAAVLGGIYAQDPASESLAQCASGDCKWESFTSLSVCSACTDLTSYLKREDKGLGLPMSTILQTGALAEERGNITSFSLPNGLSLDNIDSQPMVTMMTASSTGNASETMTFKDMDTLIWTVAMIRGENSTVWPNVTVTAGECGLWWCVQEYSSAMNASKLSETTAYAPSTRNPKSWQPLNNSGTFGIELVKPLPHPDAIEFEPYYSSVARTDLQVGSGFNISSTAVFSINDLLNKTFQSDSLFWSSADPGSPDRYHDPFESYRPLSAFALSSTMSVSEITTKAIPLYNPAAMQMLYEKPDWETTFSQLATSMSTSVRFNGDGKLTVSGQTARVDTYIRVRWWYIILPAALIIAGAVFLAIVVFHTRRSDIEIWRTSSLPVLAVGAQVGDFLEGAGSLSEIEVIARKRYAGLTRAAQRGRGRGSESGSSCNNDGATEKTVSVIDVTDPSSHGRGNSEDGRVGGGAIDFCTKTGYSTIARALPNPTSAKVSDIGLPPSPPSPPSPPEIVVDGTDSDERQSSWSVYAGLREERKERLRGKSGWERLGSHPNSTNSQSTSDSEILHPAPLRWARPSRRTDSHGSSDETSLSSCDDAHSPL